MLRRAEQAQAVMAVALERQHGVDEVLEHPRARERTVLGDVADEHQRARRRSWPTRTERGRALAHLADRPGGRAERGITHGLDRVDHDQLRAAALAPGPASAGTSASVDSHSSSCTAPRRSARARTCDADSSADTYSTRRPPRATSAATCRASVDLPMPGSPPSKVAEPATSPPPNTRSSSVTPVVTRMAAGLRSTWAIGMGPARSRPTHGHRRSGVVALLDEGVPLSTTRAAPDPGRDSTAPHSLQRKVVRTRDMPRRYVRGVTPMSDAMSIRRRPAGPAGSPDRAATELHQGSRTGRRSRSPRP